MSFSNLITFLHSSSLKVTTPFLERNSRSFGRSQTRRKRKSRFATRVFLRLSRATFLHINLSNASENAPTYDWIPTSAVNHVQFHLMHIARASVHDSRESRSGLLFLKILRYFGHRHTCRSQTRILTVFGTLRGPLSGSIRLEKSSREIAGKKQLLSRGFWIMAL